MKILSAHPIEARVRERIMDELSAIEARHQVKILFACESGSRGWGFASPDSDYDVRFIYVHSLDWYLNIEKQRDVIEVPISDELDICGWELRKALGLLGKSNPTLFEWLDSPVIYRQEDWLCDELQALKAGYFSAKKARWHYLSMAKKNFRGYLQGDTVRMKKYLYVLRPLLAMLWIDSRANMPPMRFADLAQAMLADQSALAEEINQLLAVKMSAGEAEYGARFPCIHAFIEQTLAQEVAETSAPRPLAQLTSLDRLLYKAVHAEAA
ncbi:nucleotidyltransferase domain-containing protein [Iodobacter sp. LRB]|uniref:nucleotidyltransferase domain-containing protein n=1 Tax=unclassified Iodobacter TaxID=235634 RepID=UPI000C0E6338|nr:nucleotidyltransferase domain-containing protein [Iodobacter sp. BJB302]PHV02252.1 nucleotidyltransferase [Iodobacter sp. BJB302]